ncbi:hypothetical protein RQP46_006827 [Phenoliferia psychrophenolica]
MDGLCAVCPSPGQLKCSRCKSILFCSVEHQALLWPFHKHSCKLGNPLGLTFTQPSLTLPILRHCILGSSTGDHGTMSTDGALAKAMLRFNQLYHPSTRKTLFLCFQPIVGGAGKNRITTPDDILWKNYQTIMRWTAPEGRNDAIGTVLAWFASHDIHALPPSLAPFAMLAGLLLGPPSHEFCGESKLSGVYPEMRNALELQAMTVLGLVQMRETELVEGALARLGELAGKSEVMMRLYEDVAKVARRTVEAIKKQSSVPAV